MSYQGAHPSSSTQRCTGHCNPSLHRSPCCYPLLASNGGVGERHYSQKLSQGGRKSNQRSSSVQDNTSVVKLSRCVTKSDGIKVNLPVCLASQRDLGHLASVVSLVHATKHSLRFIALTVVGVAKVEGDDRLIKKALVNHVVEGWNDLVDADGIIAETHDSIKATEGKRKARLLSSFSKVLVLDLDVADLDGVL